MGEKICAHKCMKNILEFICTQINETMLKDINILIYLRDVIKLPLCLFQFKIKQNCI